MDFDPSEFGIPTGENSGWGPNALALGYREAIERRTMAVGLDLGTVADYSVVAAVEMVESPEVDAAGNAVVPTDYVQRLMPPRYEIRNLTRLPLAARGESGRR